MRSKFTRMIKIHFMRSKKFLKILLGIFVLLLLGRLLTTLFLEPLVRNRLELTMLEKNKNYKISIGRLHIKLISRGIELKNIKISSGEENQGTLEIYGEIELLKVRGINVIKIIFTKDIDIKELTISNSDIKITKLSPDKTIASVVLPHNVCIDRILVNKMDLGIKTNSNSRSFSVKEGFLKIYNLELEKYDTISPQIISQFDFKAKELISVSADSMYSYYTRDIIYSKTLASLACDSFSIHPNYKEYDFTSRHKFQSDRIEANISGIGISNFSFSEYIKSGSLAISSIKIEKMDMNVFRDKRKEFHHKTKPAFQDMIYSYRGIINIDTIGLLNGNITYTEHAKDANKPGSISFNEIKARIYKISNDIIYKSKNDSLKLSCEALLMGKSKITFFLKGRIYDPHNMFFLNGTASGIDADKLNPILEKSAYMYASGKIDEMKFSFAADNLKAKGKMTLLYNNLDITVKNKRTDDTTAFKERLASKIANNRVLDSNPSPGETKRDGIIDYERDPERFLISYCLKSILSGIKFSLAKNPRE
jgi:hypothetical protein